MSELPPRASMQSSVYTDQRIARAKSVLEKNLNKSKGAEVSIVFLQKKHSLSDLLHLGQFKCADFSFLRNASICTKKSEWNSRFGEKVGIAPSK